MIKFSERQLRIPKLMRPVYLVTAGQSKFDRAIPEKKTEELCIDAFTMAARMIDKAPAELKSYIHSAYYGHFADHFGDQLLGEAVIHDRLGLDPLGNIGVKTGGATGGSTLWEGVTAVASGYSDCVLLRCRQGLGDPTRAYLYRVLCCHGPEILAGLREGGRFIQTDPGRDLR